MTACAASEKEGITGHKYALTSMGLRGQVTPLRKKRKMIFYKKNSFKGCMKLEFEPPRVKNDGNLEEVVPLLWCSERQILSVMEAERHMLKRRKISTTPKPGGCTVLKYEQMLRPKQVWREIIHTKRTPWAPIHHTSSKQPLEAGIVLWFQHLVGMIDHFFIQIVHSFHFSTLH